MNCAGCGRPDIEHQGAQTIEYTAGGVLIDSHVVPPAGLVYPEGTYFRPCSVRRMRGEIGPWDKQS